MPSKEEACLENSRPLRDDPFGQRYLRDECAVFDYNAWDDVDWPEEREAEIQRTIQAQLVDAVPESVSLGLLQNPKERWESFFETHSNKFFMDRKWLTREFPELFSRPQEDGLKVKVLDVGCGVGNTTIPLLESTEHLFMYSCDFSSKAVETLRNDKRIAAERCQPFVWDITEASQQKEVANGTLDFVLCIFVLSAVHPDRLRSAVLNLVELLRPGGMLLLKDYGRHDLTQLRFKSSRLIRPNLYRRGDDTLVYFFTTEEMDALFKEAGLEKIQNFMDKRLVVNRAKRNKKILLKLCCEVAKHRPWLQKLACRPAVKVFIARQNDKNPTRALVLIFELLFGKWKDKLPTGGGKDKQRLATLRGLKGVLQEEANLLQTESVSPESLVPSVFSASLLPRYVRVNTNRTSFSQAVEQLERDGWRLRRLKKGITPSKYRKLVSNLERPKVYADPHIDDLLIFPRGVDLHDYCLVVEGALILQDKASCLSAFVLQPEPGASAMDVCAAPGMKTTHLAAIMQNRGKIWAFDRDQKRVELMRQIIDKTGTNIVNEACIDFLRVNLLDAKYKKVKFVVVDPPCSGSGMAKRGEHFDEFEKPDEQRVKALANLQVMLLKHAFRLPSLQRLVYSTCSVHWPENEGVILEVLSIPAISNRFRLINALPQWRHRGQLGESGDTELENLRNSSRHRSAEVWRRAYLKDLFHRRQLLGPDPMKGRASEDNWNYPSEISALSHRLHIPEMDDTLIVQALTDKSYFTRKDLNNDGMGPLADDEGEEGRSSIAKDPSNDELVDKGLSVFRHILLAYLRAHWPVAPEEFIVCVASRIASMSALVELATQLGLHHVSTLLALVGAMEMAKARDFVRRLVLPRLYEVPLEDVLPFRHPFAVLTDYMRKWEGITDLEVRTIDSGAVLTATPFYEVAIYAEKKRIVGQHGGELPWVALDLAAQNGLLRLWRVSDQPRVFPFKFEEVYATRFDKAQQTNHRLRDVCGERTDLRLYTPDELARDPIDMTKMSKQYFTKIKPKVGIPHRRRQRHMFSRGTINRMSFRAFVKPTPHTI
uniref:Large ribosomal subunit protein mL44 n=1 Tax=Globodera rostochiensis TaxID=31243 RepID=A0A914HWZ8_GLORO